MGRTLLSDRPGLTGPELSQNFFTGLFYLPGPVNRPQLSVEIGQSGLQHLAMLRTRRKFELLQDAFTRKLQAQTALSRGNLFRSKQLPFSSFCGLCVFLLLFD